MLTGGLELIRKLRLALTHPALILRQAQEPG